MITVVITFLLLGLFCAVVATIAFLKHSMTHEDFFLGVVMVILGINFFIMSSLLMYNKGILDGHLSPASQNQLQKGVVYYVTGEPLQREEGEKPARYYTHLWWVNTDFHQALFELDECPPPKFFVDKHGKIIAVE